MLINEFQLSLYFCSFKITASKILVTAGENLDGVQTTSEVVDSTVRGDNMCKNWPDLPIGITGATGGLIGNTALICGGWHDSPSVDECYSLTSEKATLVTHMSIERFFPACIVLNDNMLWITGGYNSYSHSFLASTEKVTLAGTMPGPELPKTLYEHAMVAINRTVSMVISGSDAIVIGSHIVYSASTYYYNHIEGEWSNGHSLMQARCRHAAGIVTDEFTNENFVVVTGGYKSGILDSTEFLQDGKWVQGKICIKKASVQLWHFFNDESKLVKFLTRNLHNQRKSL